jgi:hypothetical protein
MCFLVESRAFWSMIIPLFTRYLFAAARAITKFTHMINILWRRFIACVAVVAITDVLVETRRLEVSSACPALYLDAHMFFVFAYHFAAAVAVPLGAYVDRVLVVTFPTPASAHVA